MQPTERRQVIRCVGLGLAGGLAGCTQSQPAEGGETTPSPTETVTATETPTVTETTAEVTVELVASFPVQTNGRTEQRQRTVLAGDDIAAGTPQRGQAGTGPFVSVELTESGTEKFSTAMRESGFTSSDGISACRYEDQPDDPGYCLHTVVDGEIVSSASMAPGLADLIETGEFQNDPVFRLTTTNMSEAQTIATSLRR